MANMREKYARAFAIQGASDFRLYQNVLCKSDEVETCHKLHYLQMACEKIAKAYMCKDENIAISKIITSHVAFSRFIEGYMRSPLISELYNEKINVLSGRIKQFKSLAREIELLAPAVDQQNNPHNSEYPWKSGNDIIIPCEYSFSQLRILSPTPATNDFLRIIKIAIENAQTS